MKRLVPWAMMFLDTLMAVALVTFGKTACCAGRPLGSEAPAKNLLLQSLGRRMKEASPALNRR
jgi:hypothetical protein